MTSTLPDLEAPRPPHDRALLEMLDVTKHFEVRGQGLRRNRPVVRAVEDVSFTVRRGQVLGVVGESGCGKSTTGRLIAGLETATAGSIVFDGREVRPGKENRTSRRELRDLRRRVQMVFQDPLASLDPRMTVGASIAEPLTVQRLGTAAERRERVADLLTRVGLAPDMAGRFPAQFSGGQRQRIGIARALAIGPDLIVADEPTSALDVSVRAQVVNLLQDLQRDTGVALLFISHDMSTIRYLCDDVVVMYLGKVMEVAPKDEIFNQPRHPYTQALLSAVPIPEPEQESKREQILLSGERPSVTNPPPGCRFSTRCPMATDRCRTQEPVLREVGQAKVACHYA